MGMVGTYVQDICVNGSAEDEGEGVQHLVYTNVTCNILLSMPGMRTAEGLGQYRSSNDYAR
jgi:hypothetical protein